MKKIVKGVANRAATAFPPFRKLVQFGNEMWGKSQGFQNLYSKEIASASNAFSIFSGEWSSAVPGFETGKSPLFNDDRMHWTLGQLGPLQGKRVLEGGHTWMLEHAGARVTAIEANQRAFLKCLIAKNALHLETEFLYGDFRPYVAAAEPNSFDLVVAFGVLYHMAEPVKLLHDLGRITDAFALWTHYYDRDVLADRAVRFDFTPQLQSVNGKSVQVYEQRYLSGVKRPGYCGGSAPTSFWLSRQGMLDYIEGLGFEITIGGEQKNDPVGPHILLLARRPKK
jgi:Methyltransferase domain